MGLELDGVNGIIKNSTSDGDVTIKGNDGGSEISALVFDMSAEGGATFNNWLEIPDYIYHTADSNTYFGFNANDNFELFAGGTDRLSIVGSETVFNDGSADKDFRVEGNGDANLLFVDAGNNKIGIGTNSPAKLLSLKKDGGGGAIGIDIHNQGTDSADDALITFETQGHRNYSMGIDRSASSFVVMSEADGLGTARITVNDDGKVGILNSSPGDFNDQGDHLVVGSGSGDTGITLYSGSGSGDSANIFFADGTSGSDPVRGGITYKHDDNSMLFRINDTNRLEIADGGATTITVAGNEDTLTLTSTDADANSGPNLRIYRNSSSPADADILGVMEYEGRNDNSQDVRYVQLTSQADDVSDGSEDGSYYITTSVAGTLRNRINVRPTEVVVNEESIDSDFRVESNGNANMLFVNGGTDRIGVGINDPVQALEVRGQIGISASGTGSKFLGFYSSDTLSAFLEKSGDNLTFYNVDAGNLTLATGDAERVRIHSNGVVSATAGVALGVGTANTASNVLDDYEEGTWTPTLVSDAGAAAYSSQVGHYTKIGRMVYINCNVKMSTVGSFAGATTQVNGLPFTSGDKGGNIGAVKLNGAANAATQGVFVRVPGSSAFVRIENASGTTTTDNNMNANRLDTDTTVNFSMAYFT